MYYILLLHEKQDGNSRLRDYVQLGGYEVMEGDLQHIDRIWEMLYSCKLVLVECNNVEAYFGVCGQIREMTRVPIMVVSDCDGEWEKIKMFEAGVDDYLTAPYRQTELVARIRAHIDRYYQLTRPFGIIKVRDLEINIFERRVYLGGELVGLRLKEFDTLLYLAQRPNKVVTKEDIYMAVWKDSSIVDNFYNTVAVHVKRVRERIEEDIENPKYIETVWGIGYRFLG